MRIFKRSSTARAVGIGSSTGTELIIQEKGVVQISALERGFDIIGVGWFVSFTAINIPR